MIIAAVLFPRSQELWRIRGRERRNPAPLPLPQSGASREEARKYWGFSRLKFRGERIAQGLNGGGKGAGCELSRRGEAKRWRTLREPRFRAIPAGLRTFAPARDWGRGVPIVPCSGGSNPALGSEPSSELAYRIRTTEPVVRRASRSAWGCGPISEAVSRRYRHLNDPCPNVPNS